MGLRMRTKKNAKNKTDRENVEATETSDAIRNGQGGFLMDKKYHLQ